MNAPVDSTSGRPPRGVVFDPGRVAIAIVALASLVRLGFAAILPAGVDEAYAIGIARQVSLSYFDHPPLHFWLVGAWARLWGSENLLLLRLPFILLFAVSGWLMHGLTRTLFGAAAAVWAVALLNLAPVFGLAHGSWILPDGPLIAASLATAWVLANILFTDRPHGNALRAWVLAGLLAGLALLSKYHGVLLVSGVFLFLVTSARHRVWLSRPGPWVALAIAAAMLLPVFLWNAGHDWASFRFQAGRGGWGRALRPEWLGLSLAMQSLYLLPWILVPLALALGRGLAGGPRNDRRWFLACLALLPILIFTVLTLFARGLPHWQMPGWLFAIPLLAEAIAKAGRLLRRVSLVTALITGLALVLLAGGVAVQARWARLDPFLRAVFGPSDPTDMVPVWESLKGELEKRGLPGDGRTFIAALHWSVAGQLNALFGKDIPVLCLCADARQFAYLHPPAEFAGWTGILIDEAGRMAAKTAPVSAMFESLGAEAPVDLPKGERNALRLGMRVGTGFRPEAAP